MTIRDTLSDWAHQRPNALTVQRIAGPPDGPPLSHEQQLQKVITKIKRYFAETVKGHTRILAKPANVFATPEIKATDGMLVTQAYSLGHFELAKDQVLVLTIHPGSAKYVTVPVTNLWGTTMDPVHHVSSRNLDQAAKNPDGSFTVIVSPTDPGLANWVDTEGTVRRSYFPALGGHRRRTRCAQAVGREQGRAVGQTVRSGADDIGQGRQGRARTGGPAAGA